MKKIVVTKDIFAYKAAILENDKVMEVFIERESEMDSNGSIFKGRVSNVIQGMDAAFIDIGLEKNGFMYIDNLKENDEFSNPDKNKKIGDFLKVGREIFVQATSEAIGTKGVRLTNKFTLPGKYLVLVPDEEQISISKKIKDSDERTRLEEMIRDMKPDNYGVILRTQAEGQSVFHLERELEYLVSRWEEIKENMKSAKVGKCIYKDNDIMTKLVRDIFTSDVEEMILDDEETYFRVIQYLNAFGEPNSTKRVKLYKEEKNIFDHYKVTESIESALDKVVWLECGGYLVIQSTEALTSIDVNTGKNIGTSNLEETIFNTNMEAAREIPRQLMLRNLGGIIIIDFIDMKSEEKNIMLLEELDIYLKKDRRKNEIVHFTNLSLIEMTRKRVGNPLSHYFYDDCPMCSGKGKIKSAEGLIEDILRELREVCQDSDISKVFINVEKDLFLKIQGEYLEFIEAYVSSKKKIVQVLEFKPECCKDRRYEITLGK